MTRGVLAPPKRCAKASARDYNMSSHYVAGKNRLNMGFFKIARGCPLSMKRESCSRWYPGDTQERIAPAQLEGRRALPRTPQPRRGEEAEAGGDTSPPESTYTK